VDVDVSPMPEVDVCPVVQVEPIGAAEDDSRFDPYREQGWDIAAFHGSMSLDQNVIKSMYPNGRIYRGKRWVDWETCLNGERPKTAAENVDITYDEFLEMLEGHLYALAGLHLSDYQMKKVRVDQCDRAVKLVDDVEMPGEPVMLAGCYTLQASQLVHGVPIVRNPLGNDEPSGYARFRYSLPDYQAIIVRGVREIAVCEEDVPLLSFDAIREILGTMVESDALRGEMELEFGYLPYLDEEAYKLVPTWYVRCEFQAFEDMPEAGNDYREYYLNAQTGELMKLRKSEYNDWLPPLMPDLITWADVR